MPNLQLYRVLLGACLTASNAIFGHIYPSMGGQSADLYSCESIILGECIGSNNRSPTSTGSTQTLPGSCIVYFRPLQILKGPPISTAVVVTPITKKIPIKYDIADHEMLKPEKTTLPKTGSRWILFIPDTIRHGNLRAFETFNGSVGRIYCNQANIGEVYSALYLHKSFEKYKEVFSHEPSLTAEVGYTLTRDGRILGAHLIKQSQNE